MLTHLRAVWTFRHFWLSLVRMDLRTRYRRSVLGIGWSVLHPVLMSAVIVMGLGGLLRGGGADMPPTVFGAFLLPGLCAWDFLRNSTVFGGHALVMNEAYIRQCPLPYGIYSLRTVMGTGVHFVITLLVSVALVSLLFGLGEGSKSWATPFQSAWCLPGSVAILFVFCWGTATMMAFAAAYFPDTQHLAEVTATMLFFLTPVMIPEARLPEFMRDVAPYNPFVVFLELVRTPLFDGVPPPRESWAQAAALAAASFAGGSLTIRALQKKVIFQL